jgi:hypothetical protein
MRFRYFVLFLSCFLSACGSTQKIERDRVGQVKNVAVIGFGLQQMRPNEASDLVGAVLGNDEASMNALPIASPSKTADEMYRDLSAELGRETGWKIMSQEALRKHPAYQAFYAQKTKQPQFRPLARMRTEALVPEGIVEGFLLANLTEADRAALMRELGVDGVVVATVSSNLVNDANVFEKLIAKGTFRREIGVRFEVFDRRGTDAIWFDGKSREESKEGIEHGLGFTGGNRLEKISIDTAHRVFAKLASSYKTL